MVGRSIDSLKGFVRGPVIRSIKIEVVVTNDVPPWHAYERYNAVVCFKQREIIKENISKSHPELGIRSDQFLNGIARHEVEFLGIA